MLDGVHYTGRVRIQKKTTAQPTSLLSSLQSSRTLAQSFPSQKKNHPSSPLSKSPKKTAELSADQLDVHPLVPADNRSRCPLHCRFALRAREPRRCCYGFSLPLLGRNTYYCIPAIFNIQTVKSKSFSLLTCGWHY